MLDKFWHYQLPKPQTWSHNPSDYHKAYIVLLEKIIWSVGCDDFICNIINVWFNVIWLIHNYTVTQLLICTIVLLSLLVYKHTMYMYMVILLT